MSFCWPCLTIVTIPFKLLSFNDFVSHKNLETELLIVMEVFKL